VSWRLHCAIYNRQRREFEEKYKLLKVKRIEEFDKEIREVYKDIQKARKDLQVTLQSTKTSNEQLVKKRLKEITNDVKNIEQIQEKIEKVFYETKVPEDERGVDVGDSVRLIRMVQQLVGCLRGKGRSSWSISMGLG